jgi:hypothetical protein
MNLVLGKVLVQYPQDQLSISFRGQNAEGDSAEDEQRESTVCRDKPRTEPDRIPGVRERARDFADAHQSLSPWRAPWPWLRHILERCLRERGKREEAFSQDCGGTAEGVGVSTDHGVRGRSKPSAPSEASELNDDGLAKAHFPAATRAISARERDARIVGRLSVR